MVSFVCDACQETLKKAKLESHLSKCRNAQFSCIDCSVSFSGNSFKSHTSCISEEQKYQGHLYKPKATKPVENANFAKPPCKSSIIAQIEEKFVKTTRTDNIKPKSEKIIEKAIKKVLKMDGNRSIVSLRAQTVALVREKDASIAAKRVKRVFDSMVTIDSRQIE